MGFVMPRPLPPVPKTLEGMSRQHRLARLEAEARRVAEEVRAPYVWGAGHHPDRRPYDWRVDGL
jgi:hypothetical protein